MGTTHRVHLAKFLIPVLLISLLTPVSLSATTASAGAGPDVTAASAAAEVVTVTTANALKQALENPAGSHVRLGANIRVPSGVGETFIDTSQAAHTLELNGFKLEHYYVNRANEYDGVPIRVQGKLTVNGPGAITGGYVALECSGWQSMLIINGGDMTGKAASALRSGGLTVINGGSLTGRFGDVWHEAGLLVDNAGIVKRIDNHFATTPSTIRNGILKGDATLHHPLSLPSLSVPVGSSLTVEEWGILDIAGTLTGAERVRLAGGLLVQNGETTVSGRVTLKTPVEFRNLTIPATAEVMLMAPGALSITGNLHNQGTLRVDEGTTLTVAGNLVNSGTLHVTDAGALTVKGTLTNTGELFLPEADRRTTELNPRMQETAGMLHTLGLFQGTGTNPDGRPDFALAVKPTRIVSMVMLVRLLGKEQAAATGNWSHPFNDVPAWADNYVGYAYENGLTQGVAPTRFGSDDLATPYQYLTFLLRALGYSDAPGGDFSWQDPTVLTGAIGLTQDAYTDNAMVFLRGDVAMLSAQALHIRLKDSEETLLQQLYRMGAVSLDQVRAASLEPALGLP